jgi:hypothetical protein
VEIFSGGRIGILDDFRSLQLVDENKTRAEKSAFRQDKGHQAAWKAFLDAVRNHAAEPISYRQLLVSSYTTLACRQALLTGETVKLADFMQSA